MDLSCSCIYYVPKLFCSSTYSTSALLGSLCCKSSFHTPNSIDHRFSSSSISWRHSKLVMCSKRSEVENSNKKEKVDYEENIRGAEKLIGLLLPIPRQAKEKNEENLGILSACLVGLLTGIGVVLFNNAVRWCVCFNLLFHSSFSHECDLFFYSF